MGKFQFVKTPVQDVVVVEPSVFEDARGYFMETYQYESFAAAGITAQFVQDNQSKSHRGVLRGLHYQKEHPQGKLVRVLSGAVFDVAVDLRKSSSTFGKWYGTILSAENHRQLYVPRGFAHGFLVLSETAEFCYKCDEFYHPEDEGGILWSDPAVGIDWPTIEGAEILVSEKDKRHGSFASSFYFD